MATDTRALRLGCGSPPDNYAWEVAWWGLDEDHQPTATTTSRPARRRPAVRHGNFAGIEYYDGAIWRPVNEYYGYGLPITDPGAGRGDLIVPGQSDAVVLLLPELRAEYHSLPGLRFGAAARLWRRSAAAMGCATIAATAPPAAASRIAPRSRSRCAACAACGTSALMMTSTTAASSPNGGGGAYRLDSSWINYDMQVDNNLIGPQVGWTMNYCVGCKWNFFCNTTFGVFDNHMRTTNACGRRRRHGPLLRTGETSTSAAKDDIAFLGELRVGGSYDITCNWRGVLAYRAVALSGVATSVDQIPDQFSNIDDAEIINSDNSIVIHGVQTGVECRY